MNDVIKKVEELKEVILNSDEYLDYKKCEGILDKNSDINIIIESIKKLQKQIINKEDRNEDVQKEEIEVQSLYRKLDTYKEYINYINASRKLNESITYIQKQFEDYFNQFII